MKTINALDLRKHFGRVMDEVRYRREPCLVMKNGRQAVVMLDVETFERSRRISEEDAFIEEYTQDRITEFLKEDSKNLGHLKLLRKKILGS